MRWIDKWKAGRIRSFADLREAMRCDRMKGVPNGHEFERFLGEMTDGRYFDAPKRLQMPKAFFTSELVLAQHDRANWSYVRPALRQFAGHFIYAMRRRGVPLFVHGALRRASEQERLVREGRSRVSPPMASHVQGCAVDIVHSRFAWEMTPDEWSYVGHVGKAVARRIGVSLDWGGDWSGFYDPAHWQLSDWKWLAFRDQAGLPVSPPGVAPEKFTPSRLRRDYPW